MSGKWLISGKLKSLLVTLILFFQPIAFLPPKLNQKHQRYQTIKVAHMFKVIFVIQCNSV